jgi:3-hydroxyacyl-CoA dehydrogenase
VRPIEAIAERMDWKSGLYKKVGPYLGERTIFASNTSGLSINQLAQAFPEHLRHHFAASASTRRATCTSSS